MRGSFKLQSLRTIGILIVIGGGLVALYNFKIGSLVMSIGFVIISANEVLL